MAESLTVEVVCALPDSSIVRSVRLAAGATVATAITASGIERAVAQTLDIHRVGIFSRRVTADTCLRDGDRIEVYRPLVLDPKEARRRRAG